ncbi:cupin domain-containing protein [Taklimakanibacter deserti]|uniref:cupin domain-containing protein n=1 Tax=Taklimakanibacter deserti TaxID=2267839 RepID=UPI000E6507B2
MSDIHVPQQPNKFLKLSLPLLGLVAASAAIFYVHGSSRQDLNHPGMTMSADAGDKGIAAQRPATIVRPVSCEKLPNVPGKSITTVVVEFPPGAYSPRHRHPGSVTAFVLKGQVRSQLNDGPAETFGIGQTWFEPPGTIHMFAENASMTEPASLLATFIAEDDCGPLTIFE